jgi:hypothetical protein
VTEPRRLKRLILPGLLILIGVAFVLDAWQALSGDQSPRFLPLSLRTVEGLFMWLFGPEVGAFVGSYLALLLGLLLVTLGFVGLRKRGAS